MKKYVKIAAIALSVMALTVACKSKAPEVEMDTLPMEEVIDTTVIEEVADTIVEEVEAVAAPAQKASKKATAKKETKTGDMQLSNTPAMGNKTAASDVDRSTLKEGDASKGMQTQSITGKPRPGKN